MEYATGGELFDYILLKKRLPEMEACRIFQHIISGLEYLNKHNIAHRDLKPENLLFDYKKDIKIVDFGLSTNFEKGELLQSCCGSPSYAAPEMLLGKSYQGITVDIWSSGIILYAMIAGFLPFQDPNNDKLYEKIIKGKFKFSNNMSPMAQDLIRRILVTDPFKRVNLQQIKSHSWFNIISPNINEGLNIGNFKIPVDDEIVAYVEKLYNYSSVELRLNVIENHHNKMTTIYYLILMKKIREGKISVADLSSHEFKLYLSNPKNSIHYKVLSKYIIY